MLANTPILQRVLDKNYELSFVDGSLDIAKAKASVTANSVSTTYNGKNQTASGFSASGLVNGETESVLSGVSATVYRQRCWQIHQLLQRV